jgi:hypothetical protein
MFLQVSHLVEALVQMVGEEHSFVSIGHGAGASFAWAAVRLVPRMHKGLLLLDGVTQVKRKSTCSVFLFFFLFFFL